MVLACAYVYMCYLIVFPCLTYFHFFYFQVKLGQKSMNPLCIHIFFRLISTPNRTCIYCTIIFCFERETHIIEHKSLVSISEMKRSILPYITIPGHCGLRIETKELLIDTMSSCREVQVYVHFQRFKV